MAKTKEELRNELLESRKKTMDIMYQLVELYASEFTAKTGIKAGDTVYIWVGKDHLGVELIEFAPKIGIGNNDNEPKISAMVKMPDTNTIMPVALLDISKDCWTNKSKLFIQS